MLYSEPYIPMKLVAFAAKNDPIARKRELSLSDLETTPIIVRSNGVFESTTQNLLRTLKQSVQKLTIAMCCESPEAIKKAVSQKLGIGFLYYDAVKAAVEERKF